VCRILRDVTFPESGRSVERLKFEIREEPTGKKTCTYYSENDGITARAIVETPPGSGQIAVIEYLDP
jgi:hypothetical protein